MSSTSVYTPPISSIQASSTAAARSTYIPPFATTATFVATSQTTLARASGSLAVPTVSGHPANPTTPAFQDDLSWVSAYLLIHSLTQNSYVYAYIFWFAVALVFTLLSLLHNTGLRGGVLGAWWSKWALRRRTWRKAVSERNHRQPWSLPSNAQLLSLACLSLAVAALCVAGPNYLNPNDRLFDFAMPLARRDTSSGFDPSIVQIFRAQYTISKSLWSSAARTGAIAIMLLPLVILLALKAPPFALFAVPYTAQLHFDKLVRLHRWTGRLVFLATLAHVVLWSVELSLNRRPSTGKLVWNYVFLYDKFIFGWIAFISLTALVLLSFRPIRNLRYPIFYNSHILLTPMVLIFTALHHPPVWWWAWAALSIWIGERLWRATYWVYNNGLLGFKSNRQWVPPRSTMARESKSIFADKNRNSSFGFKNKFNSTSSAQESFEMSPVSPTPRRAPLHDPFLSPTDPRMSPESPYPRARASFGFWDPQYLDRDGSHTPSRSIDSIFDPDDRTAGASSPVSLNSKAPFGGPSRSAAPSPVPGIGFLARNAPSYAPPVPVPPGFAHAALLPGRTVRLRILSKGPFYWAPGQHVLIGIPAVSKLSTHPFSIASVCDELASYASSDCAALERGSGFAPGARHDEDNSVLATHNGLELVILVRAKKGWTRRLWNLVEGMQRRGECVPPSEQRELPIGYPLARLSQPSADLAQRRVSTMGGGGGGVLLRTLLDGPFGSTARTRWGDYASVLIVSGGSGVSFGVSILEYFCLRMSGRDERFLGARRLKTPWRTERVRFVWLVREYSHIQWCASTLRRCLALLPAGNALEVNIYVTHYKPPREVRQSTHNRQSMLAQLSAEDDGAYTDDGTHNNNNDLLAPPAPRFAKNPRRDRPASTTSISSYYGSDSESTTVGSDVEESDNSYADLGYYFENFEDHNRPGGGGGGGGTEASQDVYEGHVLDYTNFDGDDDEPLPGERRLSRTVKKEGMLRRKETKKTLKARFAKRALDAIARPGNSRRASAVAEEEVVVVPSRAAAMAMASDPLLGAGSRSPPISPPAAAVLPAEGEYFAARARSGSVRLLPPSVPPLSRLPASAPPSRLSIVAAGDELAVGGAGAIQVSPPSSLSARRFGRARPVSSYSSASSSMERVTMRTPVDRWDGRWPDPAIGGPGNLKDERGSDDGRLLSIIDRQELEDVRILSEACHPGRPKLDRILQNEVDEAKGRIAVCCCGPTSLNALMRKHVAAQISPSRIMSGDMRGSIDFISEDFEY